jgi:hypothetical protein
MDLPCHHFPTNDLTLSFQPYQIVCLEHEDARLYAEVVQLVEIKHSCWVHPLVLIQRSQSSIPFTSFGQDADSAAFILHDLRQGADLVWPTVLFRAALDVEVIPVLSSLYQPENSQVDKAQTMLIANQSLNQFIQQIWQAHPQVFRGT